jgi:hypothetical protein
VIPGLSTAKLIGLAIAVAAILSFVLLAFHWKHQAADRGEKLAVICQATRDASGSRSSMLRSAQRRSSSWVKRSAR